VGVPFNSVPLMPEDIFDALQDEPIRESVLSPSPTAPLAREKR
jgi:hypothetical protein